MRKNYAVMISAALTMSIVLASCSSKSDTGQNAQAVAPSAQEQAASTKPLDPVTLVMLDVANRWPDADFTTAIAEPIKKKYPHITMQRSNKKLDDALNAGDTFDIWVEWNGPLTNAKTLNLLTDITPTAKKFNLDLAKFDASALDALREISDNKKELYAIPYADQLYGLYYNKAIFDKFGVAYPSDGLTWQQTIDLGKKLNRLDGATQYYGLGMESVVRTLFPLSLANINPKTNKSEVSSNPKYRRAFELFQSVYASQNRQAPQFSDNSFIKDQNIAMFATRNILMNIRNAQMDWNVAQFPSYPDLPNVYGMHDLHLFVPNKGSKHMDDVMRALEVLSSDFTTQYVVGVQSKLSPLVDPKYKTMLGQNYPEFKGKNIASMLKSHPAPTPEFSRWYDLSASVIVAKATELIDNKIDLNTMLRQTDEEINQKIAAMEK
ncbi:MAG: transporter substrate-binding protein [Paenibacillus sp.]|jgi:multiple sugar transport system substrate-binding protein|nr:transporter substrate-binding protein [Paenibacillus sp.]